MNDRSGAHENGPGQMPGAGPRFGCQPIAVVDVDTGMLYNSVISSV